MKLMHNMHTLTRKGNFAKSMYLYNLFVCLWASWSVLPHFTRFRPSLGSCTLCSREGEWVPSFLQIGHQPLTDSLCVSRCCYTYGQIWNQLISFLTTGGLANPRVLSLQSRQDMTLKLYQTSKQEQVVGMLLSAHSLTLNDKGVFERV